MIAIGNDLALHWARIYGAALVQNTLFLALVLADGRTRGGRGAGAAGAAGTADGGLGGWNAAWACGRGRLHLAAVPAPRMAPLPVAELPTVPLHGVSVHCSDRVAILPPAGAPDYSFAPRRRRRCG